MFPVTDRFLNEISTSHQIYSYLDIVGPNLDEKQIGVLNGNVTLDVTAQFRRYGTFTLADPDGTIEALLVQPGVELRPFRGVKYSDGTTEVCPLGVLGVSTIDLADQGTGARSITVEAYDRSRKVTRDGFEAPYTVASGTNLLDAIKAILARSWPDLDYDAMSTQLTTTAPKVYDAASDPWAACQDLAQSMGCVVFFDAVGRVAVAPPVDIDALPSPAFTYIEGDGCTMLALDKKYSDDPGYNGVVLTGESVGDSQPPVQSIQWDTEPTSFTYYLGPYGKVPYFVQDQNVKTQGDADAAASSILKGLLGFSYQITLTTVLNPALDIGDVVEVVRAASNVNALYAIDAIMMPLGPTETATVTLRQKRVR